MRAPQLILAAGIFVGCGAAGAAASPLIPTPSAGLLHSYKAIDTVRWRHRYRSIFWSWRGEAADRGDTDGFASSSRMRRLNGAVAPMGPEILRSDPPRRGWVDPPPR